MILLKPDHELWLGTIDDDPPTLSEIVKWLNDPEVVRFSEQRHKKHTLATQLAYVQTFKGEDIYWGIYHGDSIIGTISYHIDKPNSVANVGIMIGDKDYWGMGYGFEAWKRICDYLLWKGVRKVEAGCMAINASMIRICLRYGMTEEGRIKGHFLYQNKPTDLLLFGKTQ